MNPNYQITYFGMLAERRGRRDETIHHAGRTPMELYEALDAMHHLGLEVSSLRAAVNDEFVSWEHPLKDGDRVAFLPPMSGG
jgi:molybdopterin converting factor subunit 1